MDDFVRALQEDERKAVWEAVLSDGSVVYSDDGRPGTEGPAWTRLKSRCEQEGPSVVSLRIGFLENWADPLPKNAEGYFFARASAFSLDGGKMEFFRVGHVEGDKLFVQTWKAPEMYWVEDEERAVGGNEKWIIPGSGCRAF